MSQSIEKDGVSFFPERINLNDYTIEPESAAHPEYPIRFYSHNTDATRLVSLAGIIFIPIPEESYFPHELRPFLTPWDEAIKQVMINQGVIDLLIKVGRRYIEKQTVIITGPSAISKSFVGGWIMSCLVGLPYLGITFGPSSEADEMLGGPTLRQKRLKAGTVENFLEDSALKDRLPQDPELAQLVKDVNKVYTEDPDSRFLDIFAWKIERISRIMGWGDPYLAGEVGWQDSQLLQAIQAGFFVCIDELNRASGSGLNSLTDVLDPAKTRFSVPGRDGQIIRNKHSFIVATQNATAYSGTEDLAHHLESRTSSIIIGPNDLQFYIDLYAFFVKGSNPKFVINGTTYQWKQDVQTDFRGDLELLPPTILDQLLVSLAKLHMTLITMVEEGKIGKKKRKEGGNFVIDQRDIRELLKSISKQKRGFSGNSDWESIVKTSLYQTYVEGISISDQSVVRQLIDDMPIWNVLGNTLNYDWAQGSSVSIKQRGQGKWKLSNLELQTFENKLDIAEVELELELDLTKQQIFKKPLSTYTYELINGLIETGEIVQQSIYSESGEYIANKIKLVSNGYFGTKLIHFLREKFSVQTTHTDSRPAQEGETGESHHNTESETVNSNIEKVPAVVLSAIIGEDSLLDSIEELEAAEKQRGVAKHNSQLIFDKQTVTEGEIAQINEFLDRLETGVPQRKMFQNEDQEFLELVAKIVLTRRVALESGEELDTSNIISTILADRNFGEEVEKKIKSAADLMKSTAQKEILRRVISQQIEFLPFESFELENGREVPFSKEKLFDEKAKRGGIGDLDWLLINNEQGEPELVICSRYGIKSINGYGDSVEELIKLGRFSFSVENTSGRRKQSDDIALVLGQGGAPLESIFSRVRIVKQSISIDQEIERYNQAEAKKATAAYQSAQPSATSYQQPTRTRYTSSG